MFSQKNTSDYKPFQLSEINITIVKLKFIVLCCKNLTPFLSIRFIANI